MSQPLSVCLIVGGPSAERGISLNSARSVCDHLEGDDICVNRILYYDPAGHAYLLPHSDLYSNTPSDFDFALQAHGKPLSNAEIIHELAATELVFPVIHGAFGEDGTLQSMLEAANASFVGSGSAACRRAFHKGRAAEALRTAGYPILPTLVLRRNADLINDVQNWLHAQDIAWPLIMKPAIGGSSIGVYLLKNQTELEMHAAELFADAASEEILVQPHCSGREFTVVVLESTTGTPVALLPTEIDKRGSKIFTYRQKYLPSDDVAYHTPPTFDKNVIQHIRETAERIYATLEMRDFARIDGWYLDNGEIAFSDLNPISGMEQNSFLFQQGARAGFSHAGLLRHIVRNACRRQNLPLPAAAARNNTKKNRIAVIFGGASSECQVSLMSGTNVWLKLRASQSYQPEPYLLTDDEEVWHLSYAAALNHTVEEVRAVCIAESTQETRMELESYRDAIRFALGIANQARDPQTATIPSRRSLAEFLDQETDVFLALHGGIGEDGTLQKEFERRGTRFNGSGAAASRLCVDKAATGAALEGFAKHGIFVPRKWAETTEFWLERTEPDLWLRLQQRLGTQIVVVKPRGDGCSTGVVPLSNAAELQAYLTYVRNGARYVPDGVFALKQGRTELSQHQPEGIIFEAFVQTDEVRVNHNGELTWQSVNNWIEVTVGVLGHAGKMRSLNPSLTIALDGILSLEEKFMGGTGINLTPPPIPPLGRVRPEAIVAARERMTLIANTLGLTGYARIDAFMHIETGEIQLIEVNTLPGLTASTVLFHQALAEKPPMFPVAFLERIVDLMESEPSQRRTAEIVASVS